MHRCHHPDCPEEGLYPAPKSRANLRERVWFCLDHVRQHNAQWNYFEGYSQEQIYAQMKRDMMGDRPTWHAAVPLKLEQRLHDFIRRWTKDTKDYHQKASSSTPVSRELQALQTLGLSPPVDTKTLKARYRELVKRYHPDKNPDNPKAAERFKIIAEAYMILQKEHKG